jgi:hypothetical protein
MNLFFMAMSGSLVQRCRSCKDAPFFITCLAITPRWISRGAVEDAVDARIAVPALDRQLLAEAHAAEELHRAVDHAAQRLGRMHLDHRDVLARVQALVELPGGLQHHPARGVHLDDAVGQHRLNHLEVADLLAELLALVGVGGHLLQHVAGLAHRARADLRQAHHVERAHRQLEALAALGQQRQRLQHQVVEEEFDVRRAADAHHLLVLADGEAGQALVDHEHRNFLVAGAGRDQEEVAPLAVADEVLGAVEHPADRPRAAWRGSGCPRRPSRRRAR